MQTFANPEQEQLAIVLHKFSRQAREEILEKVKNLSKLKVVNMPSKLVKNGAEGKELIVVCPDQSCISSIPDSVMQKNQVVNASWLDALVRGESMPKIEDYGFSLCGQEFYLYDPDCEHAERSVWKRNMTIMIERNLGRVESSLSDLQAKSDGLVVIKGLENNSVAVVNSVKSLIHEFKLTAPQFRELKIVKEAFVTCSVEQKQLQDRESFDLGALFRILTQNDQSAFSEPEMAAQAIDTSSLSFDEKMAHVQELEICDFNFLGECMIHIYDNSLNPVATQLCNLLGAMMTDSVIPFLTTHIVVEKITPVLKQTISALHSRAIEGSRDSRQLNDVTRTGNTGPAAAQSFLSIHIVSLEWLKQCLIQEKRLPEDQYRPIVSQVNGISHSSQTLQSQRNKIIVRQNIFKGKLFAICHESYSDSQVDINYMEKVIIENGGRVIDDAAKAKFILQEDGFNQLIWQQKEDQVENQGIIIHFRWVQECVKERAEMQTSDALHLCPLPHKVPLKAFKGFCIELSNAATELELLIFTELTKLYGFQKRWQDGLTTHLVMLNTEDLSRSKKLEQIKKFKKQPELVNLDWLLDCFEQGKIPSKDQADYSERYGVNIV